MQNLLNFAKECINLKFIHHISTYAVAGNKSGLISEDTMDDAHNFNDYYARSKMQAESIFRNFDLPHVKKRIYRPGIVIGSMSDGKIEKIDGPYYLIKFLYEHKNLIKRLESLKVFPLPYSNKAKLPLIPVDVLTRWICHAVTNPKSDQMIRSYNFMGKELISIKDFVELVFNEFNIKTKVMRLKRVNAFKHVLPMIGMPKELLSYMYSEASLDTSNRENDYPEMQEYKIQDMAHNLIKGSTNFFEGLQ
jgi:nucleoside-diphosphate-sugar epimerase